MFSILLTYPIISVISILIIFLGVLLLKVFYTFDARFLKLKEKIPGPPQLPLFGNTFELLGPPEEILQKFSNWTTQYGPRVLYRIGSYWIVALAGAKDLEKLLSSTTEIHKSVDYDQFIPWLGEGLLISKGQKWIQRRKILTPAFHFKILEQFIDVFDEQSKILVEVLQRDIQNGEAFDIFPYVARCTLDIICETAMGTKIEGQLNKDSEYIKAIGRIKDLQLYRGLRPWLERQIMWDFLGFGKEERNLIKILHGFSNKVISEKKEQFLASKSNEVRSEVKSKKHRLALLDLMLEAQYNGDAFDDEGIREETDTFMFGGHDTTATAACFTIFHVGNHPEVQKKIRKELLEVLGDDPSTAVTVEHLSKLKYLECCIKESMRLTSPVPFTARCIKNDFELEKGVVLPPETIALFFPFAMHRDESVYPSPMKYIPERFLPENSVNRDPFCYLPFSAGPRNCIGQKFAMMEEKVLLCNVFRNFAIRSCEVLEDLKLSANVILHSESGINITIRSYE